MFKQFMPKKNSKTQIRKAEEAKAHPTVYVGCKKCGIQIATLHKTEDGSYLCESCYNKAQKKGIK